MLRVEVYARALRASQNVKRAEVRWARDAPYGWAGRGRVREWKTLVWGGVISEVGWLCAHGAGNICSASLLICRVLFSDATAPRRRRQRSKHRPEQCDIVRVAHSERRCGDRPRHHYHVSATYKERRRGQWPWHNDQVHVTNNCRGQPPGRQDQVPAWRQVSAWAPRLSAVLSEFRSMTEKACWEGLYLIFRKTVDLWTLIKHPGRLIF